MTEANRPPGSGSTSDADGGDGVPRSDSGNVLSISATARTNESDVADVRMLGRIPRSHDLNMMIEDDFRGRRIGFASVKRPDANRELQRVVRRHCALRLVLLLLLEHSCLLLNRPSHTHMACPPE